MSSLLIFLAGAFLATSLTAQEQSTENTKKPASKESVTVEVEMEETVITPLNVPEDEMFRLPEDATPSLVAKKKKLVNESSKLTKYSEQVSNFIDKQNEDTVSDSEKEKLNKLLENYTKQLNEVEKAEDAFLTELITQVGAAKGNIYAVKPYLYQRLLRAYKLPDTSQVWLGNYWQSNLTQKQFVALTRDLVVEWHDIDGDDLSAWL